MWQSLAGLGDGSVLHNIEHRKAVCQTLRGVLLPRLRSGKDYVQPFTLIQDKDPCGILNFDYSHTPIRRNVLYEKYTLTCRILLIYTTRDFNRCFHKQLTRLPPRSGTSRSGPKTFRPRSVTEKRKQKHALLQENIQHSAQSKIYYTGLA